MVKKYSHQNCIDLTTVNNNPIRNRLRAKGFARSTLSALIVAALMTPAVSLMAQDGPDTDGDGIANQFDLDDDNDGILDVNEGLTDSDGNGVPDASSTDTDGDGTPDGFDLDSDNDGILDNLEARTDRSSVMALDQVPNGAIDISFAVGSNGIPDAIETSPDSGVLIFNLLDSDNDGSPDFRDTDSDNDGIFDITEAGGTDNNADGRIDNFVDTDNKGVDDVVQNSALPIFDTDGDGSLDFRDTDSDGDSIPDAVESFGSAANAPTDTDNDGAADFRESDSDGDGVPDSVEVGANPGEPVDTNGDGRFDFQDAGIVNNGSGAGAGGGDAGGTETAIPGAGGPDVDGDGIRNQDDLDDDNDGIPDTVEGLIDADGDGFPDANSTDSDGDGTPDGNDLDSDNDGLLDNREGHPDFGLVSSLDQIVNGAIDIAIPVGSNGIADILETSPDSGVLNFSIQDTDGDGTPDFIDLDSDADGIVDLVEAGGVDSDNDGRIDGFVDADDKGVDDSVQASGLPVFDTDGDGVADFRDTDSDADAIPDSVEAGANPGQPADTDGDGAADFRESDSDGDGVSDNAEAGGSPSAPADTNGDGVPDFQDAGIANDNGGVAIGGGNGGGTETAIPGAGGPDVDGDGIRNQDDLDDDNDGIPDSVEGLIDADGDGFPDANSTDSDGDGTPDGNDLDSDNDGLLDNREGHPDFGLVSSLDQIVNGAIDIGIPVGSNGIADILETSPDSGVLNFSIQDTDGDGTPDFIDLDSDADGIVDLIEAGGVDSDNDGRIDGFFDADDKGVDDSVQASGLPVFDTDGDGVADFRDTDSDADAIPDSVEAGANPGQPADTDGDGAADFRETDSDGDGVSDNAEAGGSPTAPADTNGDGVPDFQDSDVATDNGGTGGGVAAGPEAPASGAGGPDVDGDGIRNQDDIDDDNDGIPDTVEGLIDADGDGFPDANSRDTDGDGTPDGNDLDSDNDGLLDNREANPDFNVVSALDQVVNGAIDISVAVGGNGLADVLETTTDSGNLVFAIQDTDGDGTPDFIDLDSDNDGIPDLIEAGGVDADGDGQIDNFFDADDKGVDDLIQASSLPVFDTDGDGVADFRDSDSDADAIPDSVEAGAVPSMPVDTDGDGAPDFREQDADNDSVPDSQEVGANPAAPIDSDGDGAADFQDSDTATGAPAAAPVSNDVDNDGIPNEIDIDDDNDGLLDVIEGMGDDDSDTTLNMFDLDSDNDGVTDLAEAAELIDTVLDLDLNNDGRLDAAVGQNGFADVLESTPDSGTSTFNVADSDNDGVSDFLDLDSDNDGIFDAFESNRGTLDSSGRLAAATDANGLAASASNALLDSDGDGVVDNRDIDSDNDGLADIVEARGSDADSDGRIDEFDDFNGDGADDGLQQSVVVIIDTDSDGVPDSRDLDSDQDSLSDILETQGIAADLDNNGVLDTFADGDGDGLDDTTAANPVLERDTDQDGSPDQVDLDSDGDGFSDLAEAGGVDIDNDGVVDVLRDSDSDGIPDIADSSITLGDDSDQDGIDDMFDVSFIGGSDADGDGIADQFDPDSDGNGFVGPLSDSDGQGVPIDLPDDNNDGIPNIQQPATGRGIVETGLGGSAFGCSISPKTGGPDPMLLLLLGASFAMLLFRKLRRVAKRPSKTNKSLRNAGFVVAAVGSLALTGCGFGGGGDHKGRIYVGAGGLASQLEPNADDDATVSVDETQSFGGTVQLGYDLTNRFSIEGHASSLGEATFNPSGDIGYQVGGLSALVYLLNDAEDRGRREGFNVFGRLGGGTLRNQANGVVFDRLNDFHLLAGAGLEYGTRSGLGFRAEVVAHDTDARYAQLGLVYRFGSAATRERRPAPRIDVPPVPQPEVVPSAPTVEPITRSPLDSDSDGVVDTLDSCPSTPVGSPVNADGCELFNGAIEGINFESGSDQLTGGAQGILSDVAGTLRNFPDIRVSVEAHTDNQGSADSNLQLSKRRAISVARFLVEQGISAQRLRPQAYGESQPRETNDTADGRARNRRVEFQVIQ